MKINKIFEKWFGGTLIDFKNFCLQSQPKEILETEQSDQLIDFLCQKIAQNMLLYEDNLSTAKADYITLIALLTKKGLILKENE